MPKGSLFISQDIKVKRLLQGLEAAQFLELSFITAALQSLPNVIRHALYKRRKMMHLLPENPHVGQTLYERKTPSIFKSVFSSAEPRHWGFSFTSV